MVRLLLAGVAMVLAATPALAMDQNGRLALGPDSARAVGVADPDEMLDRMAPVSAVHAGDRAKAGKRGHAGDLLRDDQYLRQAFSWLDNR